MTRILLVGDDRQLRRALQITLRAAGYELGVAATGTEALARATSEPPDIVILDLGLPDLDGVAVLEGLRGWCAAPVSGTCTVSVWYRWIRPKCDLWP
jgi:two-component system, OmpR family, KDP operon response regulator KdpE